MFAPKKMNKLILHIMLVVCSLQISTGQTNNDTVSCTSCAISPANPEEVKAQFSEYAHEARADVIYFRFHLSDDDIKEARDNGPNDVFDPSTWAWVRSTGRYLLYLPMDFEVASLGLLTLSTFSINVTLSDQSVTCLKSTFGQCRDAIMAKTVHDLAKGEDGLEFVRDDAICRSAYTHSTFSEGDNMKGVGVKCCFAGDITQTSDPEAAACQRNFGESQRQWRSVILGFSIVLAFLWYLVYFGWLRFQIVPYMLRGRAWDWVGRYFGYGKNTYNTYVLPTSSNEHWVQISDEELVHCHGNVSISELWVIMGGSIRSGRILAVLRFLFWAILLTITLFYLIPEGYKYRRDMINLLNDGTEIAFNLRSIPIAWYLTNNAQWPFYVSIVLIIGAYLSLLVEFIAVMIFCIGFRERPPKGPQANGVGGTNNPRMKDIKKSCERDSLPLAGLLAILAAIIQLILSIIMVAAIAYPMIQVLIHVLVAVVIGADILVPWLVAAVALLYYLNDAYNRVREPFSSVKHLLYEEMLKKEDLIMAKTVEDQFNEDKDRSLYYKTDMDNITQTRLAKVSRKDLGNFLVMFQRSPMPRMLLEHYLEVCDHLVSKGRLVFRAAVRLLVVLVFLFLVVFAVTAFTPSGSYVYVSAEGIITGVVALVTLLIPRLLVISGERESRALREAAWKYEIKRYLDSLTVEWDPVVVISAGAKRRMVFGGKHQRRWSLDSIEASENVNMLMPTHNHMHRNSPQGPIYLPKPAEKQNPKDHGVTSIEINQTTRADSFPLYAGTSALGISQQHHI